MDANNHPPAPAKCTIQPPALTPPLSSPEESRKYREHLSAWNEYIRDRGTRYANCRLANFEVTLDKQRTAVETVRGFICSLPQAVHEGKSLLLIGPSGGGKDHLASAAVRQAIATDLSVRWTSGPLLFSRFRSEIGRGKSAEPEWHTLREYTGADVLLLSDPIGPSGTLSDFQRELLYLVVDSRWNNQRATWATINVSSKQEMLNVLGAPLTDRLIDGATLVVCDWPSRRKPEQRT